LARELFGTDGVRGVAGEKLTAELALGLGRAATEHATVALENAGDSERRSVLIIRDTRESGEMLESALAAGVTAAGGDVFLGGVLPTPAAPLLIGQYDFDLAVVVSASHNPYRDNGIKFFGGDGFKLADDDEEAIEGRLAAGFGPSQRIGRVRALHGTHEDLPRRARDSPATGRDGRHNRLRAGREQHQRWCRLHTR
jgi:phosphoglucosamine mutase